jgi:transposase
LEVATERTQATVQGLLECLDQLEPVEREGPAELCEVLSVLRTWGEEIPGICAFLPIQLSSGFMEGKNNRTKTLMRQAYGYRNRRNL